MIDESHSYVTFKMWLNEIISAERTVDYDHRNKAVIHAVSEAISLGIPAGFRVDPTEPEWPVAFIELPQGQVSWHLPQHIDGWDGHTTAQKYERVQKYIAGVL